MCVALIACLVLPGRVQGDGGVVRLSEKSGNYRVTVFTLPGPLRAGPLEVNVLVQDAATGGVLPEARVVVSAADRAIPQQRIERPATAESATNKLFHAANVDVPNPGVWEMTIMIDGPRGKAASQFEVEVAEPKSHGASLWPWLSWPALVIVAFGVHQWRAAKLASPATTATLLLGRALSARCSDAMISSARSAGAPVHRLCASGRLARPSPRSGETFLR